MSYGFCILIGYLLGSLSPSYLIARLKHVDLRSGGSGNLGASNTMLMLGWYAGVLVALFDIGKAVLAVWLANLLFPSMALAGTLAGVAAVLGHIFPFYLRFHGGKGFASYFGVVLGLNWKFALALAVAVLILTLVTDYIVVGTMTTVVSFPLYYVFLHSFVAAGILCVASLVIIYKHRANLVRIYQGTEIGLRSANRGDHRVRKG